MVLNETVKKKQTKKFYYAYPESETEDWYDMYQKDPMRMKKIGDTVDIEVFDYLRC